MAESNDNELWQEEPEATEDEVDGPDGEGSQETPDQDGDTSTGIDNGSMAYEDMRSQIASGGFKLQAMLDKLTRLYIEDMLSEEEYDDLMQLARDNASADSELSGDIEFTKELMAKVTKLEQDVASIDERIKKLEDPEYTPQEPVTTYEEYDPHKWYYKGMGCTFEGAKYDCIAPDGVVCTWSPKDYPSYWKEVQDDGE